MQQTLMVVSLLLGVLLPVALFTPTLGQAQEVTLTLQTDQATYPVGSHATVTLILDATTPVRVETGDDVMGCSWNIVMLDAAGNDVYNARARWRGMIVGCPDVALFKKLPPPLVRQATIQLHNNVQAGDPLPPGRYTVRGLLRWQYATPRSRECGPPAGRGCEPRSAEAVIDITP